MAAMGNRVAVLRSLGARPATIAGLLVAEAGAVALAGVVIGLLLTFAIYPLAVPFLRAEYGLDLALVPSGGEIAVLGGIVLAALLAGLVPAWWAYRMGAGEGL